MRKLFGRMQYVWKLISLLLLTVITYVYAMFQGGFVSWFLFYSFLPFACYSLLLALYPLRSFEVTRTIGQEQFRAGEELKASITIKRKFPFPLIYLIAEETLPRRIAHLNGIDSARKILFPWFKRTVTMEYTLSHMPRGEHQFAAIRLKTGDFFGLFEKEYSFPIVRDFLVYPSYVAIPYQSPLKRYEQGNTQSNQKFIRDTSMAIGVREYQPGDRVSWIDWKASARRNTMMTKEFEQTRSHDVYLIMDRVKSSVFEEIVVFTASTLRSVMKNGAQAGLISFGKEQAVFPLHSGEQQLLKIYDHLARVDCDSPLSLSEIIEQGWNQYDGKKAVKILITGQVNLELVRKLEHRENGHLVKIFLIKERGSKVSNEEKVILDRLNKRGIEADAVFEGHFEEAFTGVRNSL